MVHKYTCRQNIQTHTLYTNKKRKNKKEKSKKKERKGGRKKERKGRIEGGNEGD